MGICESRDDGGTLGEDGEFDACDVEVVPSQDELPSHMSAYERAAIRAKQDEDWEISMDQSARQVKNQAGNRRGFKTVSRAQAIDEARKSWQYSTTHGNVDPRLKEIVQEGDDRQARLYNFELHPLECLLDDGQLLKQDLDYFNHFWDRYVFTRTLHARTVRIYDESGLRQSMAEMQMAPIQITATKNKVDGTFLGWISKRTTVAVLASLSMEELCAFQNSTPKCELLPKVLVMARVTIDDSEPGNVMCTVTLRTALQNVQTLQDNFADYVKVTMSGVSW